MNKDYNALTNPTYETAKITSFLLLQTEDKNATKFSEIFNFKDPFNTEGEFVLNEMFKTIAGINNEARYRAVSYNLEESGYKNLLDLACGYTHRGLDSVENEINYRGIDVPVVINELNEGFKNSQGAPTYIAGDVTNFNSLKNAVKGLKGELFITSEGLLTYLNKDELKEFSQNIRNLLLEYGGSYLLTDTTNFLTKAFEVLIKDDPSLLDQLKMCFKYLNKDRDIKAESTDTTDEAYIKDFLESQGLKIEEVPYYSDKFPIKLLDKLNETQKNKLLELLRELTVWKITPKENTKPNSEELKEETKIDYKLDSDTLTLKVKGRLDSLSSPELLKLFDENKTENLEKVVLNLEDLSFISSTGTRLLNIIIEDMGPGKVFIKNSVPDLLSSDIKERVKFI